MELREAARLLYRGYIVQLAVAAPAPALAILAALGVEAAAPALAVLLALNLAVYIAFISRGFHALWRMGLRWAFWVAWGPPVIAALFFAASAAVASYLSNRPDLLSEGIGALALRLSRDPLFIAVSFVLDLLALLVLAAKALVLRDLWRRTGEGLFRASFYLMIAGILSALLIAINPAAVLVAASLIFAEYLAELFAYREASR